MARCHKNRAQKARKHLLLAIERQEHVSGRLRLDTSSETTMGVLRTGSTPIVMLGSTALPPRTPFYLPFLMVKVFWVEPVRPPPSVTVRVTVSL